MNKLNNFTWPNFYKVIAQGVLILVSFPIVVSIIVYTLNIFYSMVAM